MDEIKVISADKDGADLRREKVRNRYYLRCDGTADECEINDAISSLGHRVYSIRSQAWERIFGSKG